MNALVDELSSINDQINALVDRRRDVAAKLTESDVETLAIPTALVSLWRELSIGDYVVVKKDARGRDTVISGVEAAGAMYRGTGEFWQVAALVNRAVLLYKEEASVEEWLLHAEVQS